MALNKSDIINGLRQMGLKAGDIALVHSSLKSLGQVEGGADTVIDALLETLTSDGTLLMPSFQSGSEFYLVNRGCRFDVKNTPSECGIITEVFRRRPGVLRSLSPTHCTAACGRLAEKILAGHERCKISVGFGSPYHRLVEMDGKILLLGVTHGSNTTLHFVENTNGAPTICRQEYNPVVVDENGVELTILTFPHMPGLPRDYLKAEPLLLRAGVQANARIGMAEARLIQAGAMAALLGEKIRERPLFLIKPFVFS
ncbi:MAG: AAC(3) family N-acetyltransferase [Verrucomicrobiota bacterium]